MNNQQYRSEHIHIMPDIETLSTAPNAGIVSIGVAAGTLDYSKFFTFDTSIPVSEVKGHIDPATLEWWFKQPSSAIDSTFNVEHKAQTAIDMLYAFSSWFNTVTSKGTLPYTIYGNAASFDLVVLREAFKAVGMHVPWNFRNESCYRTLKNTFKTVQMETFIGTKHNALDDAINQFNHLTNILNHIDNMENYYAQYTELTTTTISK